MARNDFSQEHTPQGRVDLLRCEYGRCERVWHRPQRPGPAPRFCSDACKQADYRARLGLRSEAARSAYVAVQQERRRAWQDYEAAAWLRAERARREREAESVFSGLYGHDGAEDENELVEARSTVFWLAGVPDDGTTGLEEAFRSAAARAGSSPKVVGQRLLEAKRLLQAAGRWR